MGWWISLEKKKCFIGKKRTICAVTRFYEGGTRVLGGQEEASISTTYNYGKFYNFSDLHNKKAKNTIKSLQKAVTKLGTSRDADYWAQTPGNVGHTCSILLGWAKLHPKAIWKVH